ncbi:MAG TPA: DMT family transporter [Roseiarcus sp.]|jgi:drug/metabolite transporter (DMT)-like permease
MTVARAATAPERGFLAGALYVLAAGLSWSFTGIFLRLAPDLDSWQFLLWRNLGVASAFALILRAQGAGPLLRRFAATGWVGAIVALALCLASIAFIIAMKTTTVANALFLSSCAPLLAALLGYVFLGERLSLRQAASVGLGLAGIGVIVGGGLEAGHIAGNISAVLTALGFAGASVAMRYGPPRDYSPAVFAYGLIAFGLSACVCLAKGVSLLPSASGVLAAFGAGFLVMGLGFTLFLRGAPHVPAAAQTVLAQTETIFGPIWVWLAFGETPAAATLIGGAVILGAVISMAAAGASPRAPAAAT